MLLEELITNCPGIKMGQKNGQKVLKNAKKSQNTFHLISTVSKHWVKLKHEQWSWCGKTELPDLEKSHHKVLPDLAKSLRKLLDQSKNVTGKTYHK